MIYSSTDRDGIRSLSLIDPTTGQAWVVPGNHPHYDEVLAHLQGGEHDHGWLIEKVAPVETIATRLAAVTDLVTYSSHTLWIGEERVPDALHDHLLSRLENGDDNWVSLVRFLERVDLNPSRSSREHLYEFVRSHGLTVTPDGLLLAYKGVQNDGLSIHAGRHVSVDGVPLGGHVQVPNVPGSVISIPRRFVDDDRGVGCSTGLHVGSYKYAKDFGQRLLLVEVDPAHVVSVPSDSHNAKIRVEQYKILDVFGGEEEIQETTFDPHPVVEEEVQEADIEEPLADWEKELYDSGKSLTLSDRAASFPALRADLHDPKIPHKAVARKYSEITTESSVRRYRKSNGIKVEKKWKKK